MALLAGCTGETTPRTERGTQPPRPPSAAPPEKQSRGCDVSPRAAPPEQVPHYDMSIRVDPAAGVVAGKSRVTFVAERATRRLVFRLWPNGPRLAAEKTELRILKAEADGARPPTQPDPTTLIFDLRRPLPPGEETEARLRWSLRLPGPIYDRISRRGDSIRLGSFFPILSWEGDRGWATDPPTTTLAESSTSPTADFDVEVDVRHPLEVIATGREKAAGEWVAEDVRDFAMAVGFFESQSRITVETEPPVNVLVGVARGLGRDAQDFAEAIERALLDLTRRYGPYPWETFSMAIMPDLGRSGIEYPAMVFQGEDSLRFATTHEVAHSWFYGLVGNNQARDPWLDEGVTSWAQARADGALGYFRDFEIPAGAQGQLGQGMGYWDGAEDDYYAGAYAQGVKALDALGDARLVDCALRRYVAAHAYGIAAPDDLVGTLEEDFPRARRVLGEFGVEP